MKFDSIRRLERSSRCLKPHPSLIAGFFVFLLFVLSSPSKILSQDVQSEGLDRPVVKVNEGIITARMLKQAIDERMPRTGHSMLSERRLFEIRKEELNALIVKELLVQEAIRLKIKVDKKAVRKELQKIRDRFETEEDFERVVSRQDLTIESVREGLERQNLIEKVTDQEYLSQITISDADLKEYYDENTRQFIIPPQIRLRLLLIKADPSGLKELWEEKLAVAQELSDQAKRGEDFVTLVTEFSEDVNSLEKEGDTGLLHQGRLPFRELESVAFSYEVGEVSDPVQTLYGYVVFKVEGKIPVKQLSFNEVNKDLLRGELEESAKERRWEEWIKNLRESAEISFY